MDNANLKTLTQVEEFLKGEQGLFCVDKDERYPLLQRTLTRFGYENTWTEGEGRRPSVSRKDDWIVPPAGHLACPEVSGPGKRAWILRLFWGGTDTGAGI
jgi:hypothetical protein